MASNIKVFVFVSFLLGMPFCHLQAAEYYIATTELNVRAGAGKNFPIKIVLKEGEEVELLSKEGKWYQIIYSQKTGYVHSDFLMQSHGPVESSDHGNDIIVYLKYVLIIASILLLLFISMVVWKAVRDNRLIQRVTNKKRGTKSERDLALKLLKYGIPEDYIFHDLYIELRNGEFSQVDLVALTDIGILVFEVKEYGGWIFGNGKNTQWTQVLAYGNRKYYFYNPIQQNAKHIEHLKNKLPFNCNAPVYSVIVFYGDCELRNIEFVPKGTFILKPYKLVNFLNVLFDDNPFVSYNKDEVSSILRRAVENGDNVSNQSQHANNIKEMLGIHRIFK